MKQIIFDCDSTAGIPGYPMDDALALFYLMGRPREAEVLAVTCTFGNGTTEQVYRASRDLLSEAGTPSGDLRGLPGRGSCERCSPVYCGGDQKKAGRDFLCGHWLSDEPVWGQPPGPGDL